MMTRGAAPADLSGSAAALVTWIGRAFAAGGGAAASAGYHVLRGWGGPYPEITGYYIPTLLAASAALGRPELRALAGEAGEWLARTRLPEGAACRKQWTPTNATPSVFNTGQVLQGWCALYRETHDPRWLAVAREAGDWLVREQDGSGAWVRSAFNEMPHAYYSRVAWPLIELGVLTGDARYADAARRQLRWVLAQQMPDGWFRVAGFTADEVPTTHTIAYVLEGLVESGLLVGEGEWVAAAERGARAMLRVFDREGQVPGRLGAGWRGGARWRCLTGDAQLGVVWARLADCGAGDEYRQAARRIAEQLRRTQQLREDWPEISGAIQGSYPHWGEYDTWAYPTHAAKFMLDLILRLDHPGAWSAPVRAEPADRPRDLSRAS